MAIWHPAPRLFVVTPAPIQSLQSRAFQKDFRNFIWPSIAIWRPRHKMFPITSEPSHSLLSQRERQREIRRKTKREKKRERERNRDREKEKEKKRICNRQKQRKRKRQGVYIKNNREGELKREKERKKKDTYSPPQICCRTIYLPPHLAFILAPNGLYQHICHPALPPFPPPPYL